MIAVENLSLSIGETQILENVNALFKKGEVNIIIGKSGSGKSVLLKTILGIFPFYEGTILFEGSTFTSLTSSQKKQFQKEVGVVFQGGALFDSMNVEENVSFPIRMFDKMSKKEIVERTDYCLEKVGLLDVKKRYSSELSGGMQKRVAIARAIARNPKYLFCDEPNSGLDPKTSTTIDELLLNLTKEFNTTTIIISHDLNSVLEIGEKVFFVHDKTIEWSGKSSLIIDSGNKALDDFFFVNKVMQHLKQKEKQ